jgi:hypothetical protein
MRTATALLLAASMGTSIATPSAVKVEGTWQYRDRAVWVQIGSDGRAFQCRIDRDDVTTFTSEGRVNGSEIHWQQIWGVSRFELNGPTLALYLSGRTVEFGRTNRPMSPLCKSPLSLLGT